jgi:hypothetical protein
MSNTDWQLGFPCETPSRLSVADSGIDDPVNDTGLSSQGGDFQFSNEFARLVQVICEGSGEFS